MLTPSPDVAQTLAEIERTIRPDMGHEYVAARGMSSGAYGFGGDYLERLPHDSDDLETLIGNDVYTRMGNDEQIDSSTMLLVMMTLRRPMLLDPAFADADTGDAEFQKGLEIRDFCNRALANLGRHGGSSFRFLFEITRGAMQYGNATAEKVYELGEGQDAARFVFQSLKVKPRTSTAFIVDRCFNLKGYGFYSGDYAGWQGAQTAALTGDGVTGYSVVAASALGGALWQFLPREKCVTLTLLGRDNDPRGRSWWRSSYNAWQQKMQRLKQLDRYNKRFGEPFVFGTTSGEAADQFQTDSAGQEDRTKPKVSPEAQLLRVLIQLMAGQAIAGPHGTDVKIVQNTGDGGSLMQSIHYHDTQIVKGITFQKLATSPDKSQAKAAGQVHQDVLNSPVHYLKHELTEMVYNQVLCPLVELNYGPGMMQYVPKPNLGRIDPEDLASLLTALGAALANGGLHYSMLPELWAELGLPAADIETWMREIREERAMVTATGVQSTSATALPGQTVANEYANAEVSRQLTRAAATKVKGRQGAGFSTEFVEQQPLPWWKNLLQLTPAKPETVSQKAPVSEPVTMDAVLMQVPPQHREWARAAMETWNQS